MRNRPAISIVEVLVALVVFSIAATGSAGAIRLAALTQRQAIARREALSALEARLALLSATPCESLASNTTEVGGISVVARIARTDSLTSISLSARHHEVLVQIATEVACQ